MAAEDIAAMRILIEASIAPLQKQMAAANAAVAKSMVAMQREAAKTNAAFDKIGSTIKGALIGALSAFSVAKLISMTRETLEWADGVKTLSDRLGLSTDAVQQLVYAGREVNITAEQMTKGMEHFAVAFSEAMSGKGRGVTALKALFTDAELARVKLMGLDEQWVALSGKLAQFNRPSQIALTKAFFGEDAIKFLDLLGDGADKLKGRLEAARASGTIISPEQIARGEKMNKDIERLTDQIKNQLRQAFIDLGPVLVGLLSQLAAIAKAVRQIIDAAKNVGDKEETERRFREETPDWVKRWSRGAGLLPPARIGENAAEAGRSLQGLLPKTNSGFEGRRAAEDASMRRLGVQPGTRNVDLSGAGASQASAFAKLMEDLRTQTEKARAALDPYRAAIADLDGKLAKMAASAPQRAQAQEEFNKAWGAQGVKALKEFGAESEQIGKIAAAEALGRRDLVAVLELEFALRQKFGDQFVKANQAQIDALAKQRFAIEENARIAQEAMATLEDITRSVATTMLGNFREFFEEGKNGWEVLGQRAISVLDMISAKLMELALNDLLRGLGFQNQGPGLGGLAGALFGSGGGAASTGISAALGGIGGIGFASGGSFTVGGRGGTDTTPVRFWGTPGEEVTVRTPEQVRRSGGSGGGVTYIDARGADPAGMARVEAVLRAQQQEIRRIDMSIEPRAQSSVIDARRRGGGMASGFGA